MIDVLVINKSCSVAAREKFIQHTQETYDNGIVLQTCNRFEVYQGDGFVDANHVNHLFRVVSGLESGLLGEASIQGQVKQAYLTQAAHKKLSPTLHKLFQTALFVGKRVRSETRISQGAMSHSQAVYQLLSTILPSLNGLNITVVGVHHINENIVRYISAKSDSSVFIANRTYDKAQVLAQKYGSLAIGFDDLKNTLAKTDVLICATSAPHYIIHPHMVPDEKEMIVFDLAVPRDVHPDVANFKNIKLFNVDEVEKAVNQNIEKRNSCVEQAERIIEEEKDKFLIGLHRYFNRHQAV